MPLEDLIVQYGLNSREYVDVSPVWVFQLNLTAGKLFNYLPHFTVNFNKTLRKQYSIPLFIYFSFQLKEESQDSASG